MIRVRRAADLPECVAALRAVHDADGYPLNWPADPYRWLDPPMLRRAWVAEAGAITGHVAVQQAGDAGAAEVSRLFVTPAGRRRSIGRALLQQAVRWAVERELWLTLSVVDGHRSGAVAFYESAGWRYTHSTTADWTGSDGEVVLLRHYALPT